MRKLMTAVAVIALGLAAGCKMERGNDAQKPGSQGEIVQPQAGEQAPAQGGSGNGTGEERENRASPDQLNTSEDEVQQGQGNESEGYQGTGISSGTER